MTVPVETPIQSSIANGSTTYFPYSFTVLDQGDLVVQGTLGGVVTPYTAGVDFTVSGIGTGSGAVAFVTPPANLTVITIYRDSQLARPTDYQNNGDLLAATVDLDFNRLWLALQEIFAGGKGVPSSVRVPNGETLIPLPDEATRADKLMGFNSSGQPTVFVPASGSAAAVLLQLANGANAAEGTGLSGHGNLIDYTIGSAGHRLNGEIMVFGTGVAATDNANLTAAIAKATSAGKTLRGVGAFAPSAKVTFTCDADFRSASFVCDPTLAVAVEVRSATDTSGRPSYHQNRIVYLPQITASTFAFTGAPGDLAAWGARGEGVRITNCITCEIHVPHVYGFGTGVRLAALGNAAATACSWNTIYYGKVSNNLRNLVIDAADAQGFCNENSHIGGRFCHESPVTVTNISGCVHHKIGATGLGSNSQKFLSPSIEGDNVEYHIDTAEGYSVWMAARGEAYTLGVPKLRFTGAAARNNDVFLNVSFGKPAVTQSGGAQLNRVDWLQGVVEDGSILSAVRVMRNTAAQAVLGVVRASQDPHTATVNELTVRLTEDQVGVKSPADTVDRIAMNYQGRLSFGSGSAAPDAFIARQAAGLIGTTSGGGKLGSLAGLWVGNSAASTESIGKATTRKIQIFDEAGASLGFIPVYATIT
jgi:hypothetical protein